LRVTAGSSSRDVQISTLKSFFGAREIGHALVRDPVHKNLFALGE